MKLHNRNNSYLNALPEGTPEPNVKPRITRWVYFGILLFITGYIIFIASTRLLFSEAIGLVDVDKTAISASRSGRIKFIQVSDGDTVNQGQLIATIHANRECIDEPIKKTEQLNYEIELNNSRLNILRIRLNNINKPEQKSILRRALEVSRDQQSNNEKLYREKQKIREEIALLRKEIKLQEEKRQTLIFLETNKTIPTECQEERVIAPFDGRVLTVLKRDQEYIKRGEPIVLLADTQAKVSIIAQFGQADYRILSTGKIVDITFPDGEKSQGFIQSVTSANYAQFNGGNIATEKKDRMVQVRLSSIDEKSRQLWKNYDHMNVNVRITK